MTPRHDDAPCLGREHAAVPVTALAFCGAHLLAAVDTALLVYHAATGTLVRTRTPAVFRAVHRGQPIHGISVREGDGPVLLWGATAVCVLLDGWDGEREAAGTAGDWVYAGHLLSSPASCSSSSPTQGVVVTAHNDVVRFTCRATTGAAAQGTLSFEEPVSPSRPILYSATLAALAPEELLVAAGTVFGEIIVWRCRLDTRAAETVAVLTGHEGSIFGVDISPPLDAAGRRLLASCSDDRTVRLWALPSVDADRGRVDECAMAAVRETGFNSGAEADTGVNSALVAMAMGHASRIWGVRIVAAAAEGPLAVYSFGEDATMQRWAVERDEGRLRHQQTLALHDGKHLWAHAVGRDEDGGLQLATGGADGKISVIEGTPRQRTNVISIGDVLASAAPRAHAHPAPKRSKEIITRYGFLSGDEVVAMTSSGRILRGSIDQPADAWRVEKVEERFEEDLALCYAMTRTAPGAVTLGTTSGNVYLYHQHRGLSLVCSVPGRIMDLIAVQGPHASQADGRGDTADVYVQLQGNTHPYHLTIDVATSQPRRKQQLADVDERFVGVSALSARGYTLLGSRHGWIAILWASRDAHGQDGLEYLTSVQPGSPDAITSIVEVPPRSSSPEEPFFFLTTSRDGFYRIFQVEHPTSALSTTATQPPPTLTLVHETSALYGPTIETASFTSSSSSSSSQAAPQLILSGFRAKDFVVWNETTRTEIASIPCGGAHRMHCLYLAPGPSPSSRLRFIFTKASQIFIHAQDATAHRTLSTPGMHGREIRAVAARRSLSAPPSSSPSPSSVIATGGEDTTIRLWAYRGRTLQILGSVKSHVTGLQRLRWLGDEHLLSSAGFEEFHIWRVRALPAAYPGLAVVNAATLDDRSPLGDLRIMDFDGSFAPASQDRMLLTLVFSNSTIKTYRYDPEHGFTGLCRGVYTGACVLQVRHLRVTETDGMVILTASTDGSLCVWRNQAASDRAATGEYLLGDAMVVHQSGVKALDMVPWGEGYVVFTGGDDNAVHTTYLVRGETVDERTGRAEVFSLQKGAATARAHTASINGVAIIRGEKGGLYGVSVSNDQRVKLWDLDDKGSGRLRLVRDEYSGVADPGDVDLMEGGRLMLAGVGLEVWDVKTESCHPS